MVLLVITTIGSAVFVVTQNAKSMVLQAQLDESITRKKTIGEKNIQLEKKIEHMEAKSPQGSLYTK